MIDNMEETLQIQEEDEIKMDMEQELPCGEREQLQAEWDRLLQERQQLAREREQLENETAHLRSRFEEERKQLKKDMLFFEKKMEILKGGFAQLASDRKALERERILLEEERRNRHGSVCADEDGIRLFFSGVSNPLTLKKRYRDLIKIFHPDNVCGDTELLQRINKVYETLLEEVRWGRKQKKA